MLLWIHSAYAILERGRDANHMHGDLLKSRWLLIPGRTWTSVEGVEWQACKGQAYGPQLVVILELVAVRVHPGVDSPLPRLAHVVQYKC